MCAILLNEIFPFFPTERIALVGILLCVVFSVVNAQTCLLYRRDGPAECDSLGSLRPALTATRSGGDPKIPSS
jgi:hypothetical protein